MLSLGGICRPTGLSLGEIYRPTGLSMRPVCHHLPPLRTSSTVLHQMDLANP